MDAVSGLDTASSTSRRRAVKPAGTSVPVTLLFPYHCNPVPGQDGIAADQRAVFCKRLSHQHAVVCIPVSVGEGVDFVNVCGTHVMYLVFAACYVAVPPGGWMQHRGVLP